MMKTSGRQLYADLQVVEDAPAWLKSVREEGLPLLSQEVALDPQSYFKLAEYNLFDYMPNWIQPFVGTPEERAAKLQDAQVRTTMKQDLDAHPYIRTDWRLNRVAEVVHKRNYKYEGMTIDEIAGMEDKHPLDAMLDLALDEDLETTFSHPVMPYAREEDRTERFLDPFTHISVSDGGAHTRFFNEAIWPVNFLSYWIRDKEIMTLEQAHYKMSSLPAWFADFKDRGMLRVGNWADIMVYDLEELGFLHERPIYSNDFPGGERRLIQKPKGLRYILVNGTVTFEGNECTGTLPGKLLRSYDMIE